MDDKNFDHETAAEWIQTIESGNTSIRNQDIYPLLRAWSEKSKPQHLLEIGCGQGACSEALNIKNCRYVGIDPSLTLIKRAKELYADPNREFFLGNIYALSLSSSSFDAVFSVAVWHLLEKINEALYEVVRVLKSGGSFLLITADPSQYPAWTDHYQIKDLDGKRFIGKNRLPNGSYSQDILYLHTKEDIFSSIEKAGIKIISVDAFRNQIAIQGIKI